VFAAFVPVYDLMNFFYQNVVQRLPHFTVRFYRFCFSVITKYIKRLGGYPQKFTPPIITTKIYIYILNIFN